MLPFILLFSFFLSLFLYPFLLSLDYFFLSPQVTCTVEPRYKICCLLFFYSLSFFLFLYLRQKVQMYSFISVSLLSFFDLERPNRCLPSLLSFFLFLYLLQKLQIYSFIAVSRCFLFNSYIIGKTKKIEPDMHCKRCLPSLLSFFSFFFFH